MRQYIKLILALVFLLAPVNGWCVSQWVKSAAPATGDNLTAWPAKVNAQWSILDTELANYRQGYNLTYSSGSTIVASSGEVVVSNSLGTLRLFLRNAASSNITFSNIDTGAEASATIYYIYAGTSTATDAAATFYISTSSTAPSGVTYYKRLGSFYNDSSSNITRINNDHIWNEVGEKESKTVDVTYQAITDGYVSYEGTLVTGNQVVLYTDSSSSPSTAVQQLTYNTSGSLRTNMLYPIKSGDYYKVSVVAGSPTTEAYYFVPNN